MDIGFGGGFDGLGYVLVMTNQYHMKWREAFCVLEKWRACGTEVSWEVTMRDEGGILNYD